MFTVTVEPSGRTFEVDDSQPILSQAIEQGIGLPYSCRDGSCGSCKCKLLSGQVSMGMHTDTALSAAEEAAGYVLTCCGFAESDLVLESRQVTHEGAFPIKKLPARIHTLERLSQDVMHLRLQLPSSQPFEYFAGQYIEVIARDGTRRSYSLANAPHELMSDGKPVVDLHIRLMSGGVFTEQVFERMKEKDILRIEGPYGSFHLQGDSALPLVFLASGTGFAPLKAILQHMQFMNITREVVFYWGGRRPADLYMDAWLQDKLEQMPNLRYVPVVSDPLPEDAWPGRTGFVHLTVLQDFPDLSGHQVFACGKPAMVDAARKDFIHQAHLPEHHFFADAFTTQADKAWG